MNGGDLRTIAYQGCDTGTLVLFEDAEGHLHSITTCIKTRGEYKDFFGPICVLRETNINDFMLRVIPPPADMQAELDRINEEYDKNEND